MRRPPLFLALVCLPLGPASAAAATASPFPQGVAAGEITARSALVWTRAPRPGPVTVEVALDRRLTTARRVRRGRATGAADRTVRIAVAGLTPATRWFYRFRQGRATSPVGSFRTAPRPSSPATVRFAFAGDADAQPAPGSTEPFYNRFEVYGRMAAERNDFNVSIGDTIYSDSEVPGVPPALTRRAKWSKYRQNLALPRLRALRADTGLYSHWDDHEFVNDFSRAESGAAVYRAGVAAFTDYAPVRYRSATGLYRRFRWGRHLEVFLLDQRSFRDAKATAGGTCVDATTGIPDLAPTAPQTARNAFSALVPALAAPPPPGCLDRIRDPSRTLLGRRQYAAFTSAVAASSATFKVVMNETPIQELYALPYDRWEGYAAERERLLRFLSERVRGVVFLTTDTHANLVGDVRLDTFGASGPGPTGITEVVAGPVATMTFARELGAVLNDPRAPDLLASTFFRPPPPRGLGMRCAVLDTYAYGQVEVTARRLTVRLKDGAGRPVRHPDGSSCKPVVVEAG